MRSMKSAKPRSMKFTFWYKPATFLVASLLFAALGVLSFFASQNSWYNSFGGIEAYTWSLRFASLFGFMAIMTISPSVRDWVIGLCIRSWSWLTQERPELPGKKDQWAVLGFLRCALAAVVMICHTDNILFANDAKHWTHVLIPAGGFAAVIGFFIVSGYSIGSSVEREAEHYAYRRFWRIVPVYWAALAFCAVPFLRYGLHLQIQGATESIPTFWQVVIVALFLQNIVGLPFGMFGQSWSLSSEVVYYTFAPWLRRLTTRWILLIAALSIAGYLWHESLPITTKWAGYWSEMYGRGIGCLAWAWLAGFLAWRWRHIKGLLFVLPLGTTLLTIHDGVTWEPLGWVIVLISSLVISVSFLIKLPRTIATAGIFLGGVSYPLYLFHRQTLYLAHYLLQSPRHHVPGSLVGLLGVILCLGVASVVYVLVDAPLQRWARNRTKAKLVDPPSQADERTPQVVPSDRSAVTP